MHPRTHSFPVFVAVGFVGAFVTSFAYLAVLYFTLPPTDLAYGKGFNTMLHDPLVCGIATRIAIASGALATPLLYFCLRRRRLSVALPIVFASVLITVAVTTPFHPLLGQYSAIAALVCSCIACSQTRATSPRVAHDED